MVFDDSPTSKLILLGAVTELERSFVVSASEGIKLARIPVPATETDDLTLYPAKDTSGFANTDR
jgi:hypothetical protein